MARPRKCRRVGAHPNVTYFKPRGVPLNRINEISLPLEGFEALRLADYKGLSQEEAAAAMTISRPTFGRILSSARLCVAKALTEGSALSIQDVDGTVVDESRIMDMHRTQYYDASTVEEKSNPEKEGGMMEKVAVTSEGPAMDALIDPRFGRAAGFMLVDPQTLEFEYVENGAGQARAQGAGLQASETVVAKGAKAVLTGYVGPKAFNVLQAAGIRIAQNLENMTVRQAVEAYIKGNISWAQQSNRKHKGNESRRRQWKGRDR